MKMGRTDGRKGDGGDGGGQRMKTGFHVCVKSIRGGGGKEDFFFVFMEKMHPLPPPDTFLSKLACKRLETKL